MSPASKTRVMVVEDERIVALNLKQRLVRLGYEVTAVVTSGAKALEAVGANPPDIVLMDIHIDGDIDGIETAARIPSELNIPVVYLTAYSEEATLERARQTRPYGYLLKPFSERELHATMQMVLERRRADCALREDHAQLVGALEKETAQRRETEQALLQAQKMEAIGKLTGGVAHDFNNLLQPIIGGLDMLQRQDYGGEREKRLIQGALASAERAKTVVQRLLAFARRQPLQPGPVDLADLIAGMADLIASTSSPVIKVAVDIPPGLPAAQADAGQLEMALLNLSVNARDAMPKGGMLTISCVGETMAAGNALKLKAGAYICLTVSDNGVGMDDETVAKAIEPFFSTKGVGKGTGLGLSMVHGLMLQLGGALTITSQPDLGTKIDLWLPVSAQPAQKRAAAARSEPFGLKQGKALLVDDEDLVRSSTAEMLKEFGYEVIEVGTAREALDRLEAGERFDLVITDHLMPGMTGADLVQHLRKAYPALLALIMSGYAEVEGIPADLPRLTKPFRHADLAESLAGLEIVRA